MTTARETLADLLVELKRERDEQAAAAESHKIDMDARGVRIRDLEHRQMLMTRAAITDEQISLARSVIDLHGVGNSAGGAFQAAVNAVALGGNALREQYIGAKRYDRFHQRCDCRYGYGPTHGWIVFSVGLTPEVREREVAEGERILTPEESEAAVRYLMAERAAA